MAKSKNGGSRTYIRGKLGADVYSVGKDGKGHKQQVIRSLAESVANPQTEAQMVGRMIMSTVMQAQSYFAQIIDHSFDGVPAGQPSISEFIRANYALVKDSVGKSIMNTKFSFNNYQEKKYLQGRYLISKGNAADATNIEYKNVPTAFWLKFADVLTFDGLMQQLGITRDDYVTLIAIPEASTGGFSPVQLIRLHPSKTMAGDTVISASNVAQVFDIEANKEPAVSFVAASGDDPAHISIGHNGGDLWTWMYAIITTRKVNDSYTHSTTYLYWEDAQAVRTSDQALATYPIGSQRFLNGGEI